MGNTQMKCDFCQEEIDRHVFCSDKCRVYFFRQKTPVTISNKEAPHAATLGELAVSDIEYDVAKKHIEARRQVLNCKKHHGSSSCGCLE
jgi:hypothetical protein